jgi:hypothetical protein
MTGVLGCWGERRDHQGVEATIAARRAVLSPASVLSPTGHPSLPSTTGSFYNVGAEWRCPLVPGKANAFVP